MLALLLPVVSAIHGTANSGRSCGVSEGGLPFRVGFGSFIDSGLWKDWDISRSAST